MQQPQFQQPQQPNQNLNQSQNQPAPLQTQQPQQQGIGGPSSNYTPEERRVIEELKRQVERVFANLSEQLKAGKITFEQAQDAKNKIHAKAREKYARFGFFSTRFSAVRD